MIITDEWAIVIVLAVLGLTVGFIWWDMRGRTKD